MNPLRAVTGLPFSQSKKIAFDGSAASGRRGDAAGAADQPLLPPPPQCQQFGEHVELGSIVHDLARTEQRERKGRHQARPVRNDSAHDASPRNHNAGSTVRFAETTPTPQTAIVCLSTIDRFDLVFDANHPNRHEPAVIAKSVPHAKRLSRKRLGRQTPLHADRFDARRDHRHCMINAPTSKPANTSSKLNPRKAPPSIANAPTNTKWNPKRVSRCLRRGSLMRLTQTGTGTCCNKSATCVSTASRLAPWKIPSGRTR